MESQSPNRFSLVVHSFPSFFGSSLPRERTFLRLVLRHASLFVCFSFFVVSVNGKEGLARVDKEGGPPLHRPLMELRRFTRPCETKHGQELPLFSSLFGHS